MPENTNNESIERLVTERLDSLFGDDDEVLPPPPSKEKASPFKAMRDAVTPLRVEITPEGLARLDDGIRDVDMMRGEDPLFRPLLKMIAVLQEYLGAPRKEIHKNTMDSLTSILECMEAIVQDDALTDIQRRRRVQKEIESFKTFRSGIQAVLRAAPTPLDQGETARPDEKPTPPPVREETPAQVRETPPPTPPAAEPAAQAARYDDLRAWFQDALQRLEKRMDEGFPAMASRMDEILASLKERPDSHAAVTETLSRIERQIGVLASLPQTVNGLRGSTLKAIAIMNETIKKQRQPPLDADALAEDLRAAVREEAGLVRETLKAKLPSPPLDAGALAENLRAAVREEMGPLQETLKANRPHPPVDADALAEDLKTAVREEVDTLKAVLKAGTKDPEAGAERDRASVEALARLEKHMERILEDAASLREEIRAVRSDLSELQASARQSGSREGEEGTAVSQVERDREEEAPPEGDGAPETAPKGPLSREEEDTAEAPRKEEPPPEENVALPPEETDSRESPAEESASPDATCENLPSGSYFLFEVGEKKYAVDSRHVVKAVGIAGSLLKKARNRGGLTISDTSPGLFGLKKGLEPAWTSLPSTELKQTLYGLISDDALDGLDQSTGGGALFLAVDEKRHLILTNQAAEKASLSQEDEVQMAGSPDAEGDATCGSILRPGEGSAFYLIVSPAKLG